MNSSRCDGGQDGVAGPDDRLHADGHHNIRPRWNLSWPVTRYVGGSRIMNHINIIIDDLQAEQTALDELLRTRSDDQWNQPTPADGWTSRHQIAHLAFFDATAEMSLTDPDAFAEHRQRAERGPGAYRTESLKPLLELTPNQLLERWRDAHRSLQQALRAANPDARHPWYGPSMSLASMATARLMETWAHGQDIADTFEMDRPATARLTHIARIACLAFPYSFTNNALPVPTTGVQANLILPSGNTWAFGEDNLPDSVTGPIDDFCLVLTRRRHVADTALEVTGPIAAKWMTIGQAFAGPPGAGRAPGQFTRRPLAVHRAGRK